MAKSAYDRLLDGIQKMRSDHADLSLRKPKERDNFEYGRVCGYYQALCDVVEKSKNQLEEEKQSE